MQADVIFMCQVSHVVFLFLHGPADVKLSNTTHRRKPDSSVGRSFDDLHDDGPAATDEDNGEAHFCNLGHT